MLTMLFQPGGSAEYGQGAIGILADLLLGVIEHHQAGQLDQNNLDIKELWDPH